MQEKKEVTIHELRQMLLDEEITQGQFTYILIQNLGARKVADALYETMCSTYSEKILTDEIPEALDVFIPKGKQFPFASEPRRFTRPMTNEEKTKAFDTLVHLKNNTSVPVEGPEGEDFTGYDGW